MPACKLREAVHCNSTATPAEAISPTRLLRLELQLLADALHCTLQLLHYLQSVAQLARQRGPPPARQHPTEQAALQQGAGMHALGSEEAPGCGRLPPGAEAGAEVVLQATLVEGVRCPPAGSAGWSAVVLRPAVCSPAQRLQQAGAQHMCQLHSQQPAAHLRSAILAAARQARSAVASRRAAWRWPMPRHTPVHSPQPCQLAASSLRR